MSFCDSAESMFFFFLDGGCFTLMGLFIGSGSGALIGFFDGDEISTKLSSVSILAMTVPTSTTSFSSANISTIIPASKLGISESTLSVPISRNNSSFSTGSPTFLRHSRIVPSVIDSPIFGMTISTNINTPLNYLTLL